MKSTSSSSGVMLIGPKIGFFVFGNATTFAASFVGAAGMAPLSFSAILALATSPGLSASLAFSTNAAVLRSCSSCFAVFFRLPPPAVGGRTIGGGTLTNGASRSEEHTSELQSHLNLVCRLLLEKKNNKT